MRLWFWIIFLSGGLLFPGLSHGAGFDCANARTRVEKMICANPHLSELDSTLTSVYKKALQATDDTRRLYKVQQAWMKTRNTCRDAACLTRSYKIRIAALDRQARKRAEAIDRGWQMRANWYKRLQWPAACEQEHKQQFGGDNGPPPGGAGKNGYGVDIYRLEGKGRLAVVQCSLAAYQATFVVLRFEQGKDKPGRLLALTDYERDASGKATPVQDDSDHERAGLPTFHPATRTLTFLTYGRGLGDCGSLVTYGFREDRAVVIDARAYYCFDDPKKIITDPKKWPEVKTPSAGRTRSTVILKEAEDRLVRGGYIETLMNAHWAVEQGAPIVAILGRMLAQSKTYEKEMGGVTGAFPFDAVWALAHIPKASALEVLEKYGAASHDPSVALAIKGWKLRSQKKAAGYGVLINDAALLEKPSGSSRVARQLRAGQAVQIEQTMITSPGEEGPRSGPAHYDRVKLLPGGPRGYIGRAGDDFSPFL